MKVVTAPKEKFSWTTELEKLMIGESFPAEYRFERTISNRISLTMKTKYPDRAYSTEKDGDLLIVKRLK